MTTYTNPATERSLVNTDSAGVLACNPSKFALGASYAPSDINTGDLIQIGIVPAGCKLVPHLCRISVPVLDSNGAPTGDYSIGSATDPDALKDTAASETAVVLSGEDFTADTSELGARNVDVPVYIKALADSATTPTTGTIDVDLVIRAYDANVDSDVL